MNNPAQRWWKATEGKVHELAMQYVRAVEREQFSIFNKFERLACLYDPSRGSDEREERNISENVVASNVDTVAAVIAATEVRARFMTDDADWGLQRQARHMEWYAEGLSEQLDVDAKCRLAFKMGAALKGTGVIRVYIDAFDEVRVEHVLIDNVIVDEAACRNGAPPREMHFRYTYDKEELKAMFPKHADAIDKATITQFGDSRQHRDRRLWAGYRPIGVEEVVAIESIRIPIGKRGRAGYVPGRHCITIEGLDLLDEEWHKPHFGCAVIRWSERDDGWYGISGAERIAGHQRVLNRRNLQIDRLLDQIAFPTTYVTPANSKIAAQKPNRLGNIAVYVGNEAPKTVFPPAVSPETYKNRDEVKQSADEEFGVSRMASHGTKPAGLESGAALREYRDATTQRFALQEKAYEKLKLDVVWLVMDCCKDLGESAPKIMKRTRFGAREIEWADVDMGDVKVQIAAASMLSRTPAGRTQFVLELAQAGVISQDETRRLLRHPDLERALSIYTEALENIEHAFDMIADGEIVMPEPFMNLKMCVWRGQLQYLQWSDEGGCPEEILEALRQFVVQAAAIEGMAVAPAANSNMQMPMDPSMGAPAAPPMGADPAAMMGAGVSPLSLVG